MSSEAIRTSYASRAGLPPQARPASQIRRAVDLILAWHERARQRRQLQSLGDHMLRDIGLSRADVEREAGKPFWHP